MSDRLQFLKKAQPFDVLPDDVLLGVADLLQEVRHPKEAMIYHQEITKMKGVDIIVEGEYETFFYDSSLYKRAIQHHKTGYCYGGISVLLNRKRSLRTVIAKKGTLVYFLPRRHFIDLCQGYDAFFHYFTAEYGIQMLNEEYARFAKRPHPFEENYIASEQLYSRKLTSVAYRDMITCASHMPIYQAARMMSAHKVSCLFIKDEQEQIIGYVTDMTLRDHVIAQQVDVHQPILQVMDQPIMAISKHAYIYEAILLMFQRKIRYLLIEENGQYLGVISRNKLLSEQAQSPFIFIQSVKLALPVEELKTKWEQVPAMVFQLLSRGVKAEIVNQMITTVSDTIAQKVIEGVIAEIGPPPARFVFMALGSEGRQEQTLKTDQDNAIIYEDKANEQRELVRAYFLRFASMVSERLNEIGFSYCTGGFMAKNPKWTHSLSHWKGNYAQWIQESTPETVVNFSTFFDCRYLYGDISIMDELKVFLGQALQLPLSKFLYHMANNALQYEPPLTFFKNIKTFTKGSQQVFNLKKAMTPIVDLVRVYALKYKIFKTNTGERLDALRDNGIFTEKEYHELMQSYYYLMSMRLRKQASQIINERSAPDNYMDPKSLTTIEQVTLKEIFKTIRNFQLKIKINFTNAIF